MENETPLPADIEAQKELARSLIEQEVPFAEVVTKTGLKESIVRGIKGSMVKKLVRDSQVTNIDSKKFEEENRVENEIQVQNHNDSEFFKSQTLEGGQRSNESMSHAPPSGTIPGYSLQPSLTPSQWAELSKLDKTALMKKVTELQAQNSSLQASAHLQPNNGDGHGDFGNDGVDREIGKQKARIFKIYGDWMEQQQIANMADQMRNPKGAENKGSDSIGIKDLVEVLKFSMGQKGNRDPIDYILAGNQMRADAEKTVQTNSAATNMFDLKKEELQQTERIEVKKIDWEERKWAEEQGATGKMLEQVKGILEGPVGKVIGSIGEAAKDKYLGSGKNATVKTSTDNAKCPQCSQLFWADPAIDIIECPHCHVKLAKNPPPEQPAQQKPEIVPITTKPKKPIDESNQSDPEVKNNE